MALAEELGIPRLAGVGNKALLPDDGFFFAEVAAEYGVPVAAVVPHDPAIVEADRQGTRVDLPPGPVSEAIDAIIALVESPDAQRARLLQEKKRVERQLAELAR